MIRRTCPLTCVALLVLLSTVTIAPAAEGLLAFPGAEGFGAKSVGGRGGRVIFVTNLDDYRPGKDQPVEGSFRAAIEAEGPRTVVFRISGVIELKTGLGIKNPFITIAGQTAPGAGICLRRFGCQITAHDVILRHLRFRPGDEAGKELDALAVYETRNVIIDHCSTSWSVDESLSVTGADCTNVTVQWCLIAESLNNSRHAKGEHGYGSLIRTDGEITFHHNLYAHHKTRCPRPGTYGAERGILFDFRNNVIYDWINPAGYSSTDKATLNYVGNYLKPGPSTKSQGKIFNVGGAATTMYLEGNVLAGTDAANQWKLISNPDRGTQAEKPFPTASVKTEPADAAYARILGEVGAILPRRDAVDERIVGEVKSGGGRVIDSPNDVGGWPKYPSSEPPADRDGDGLPDAWEQQHGLGPDNPADGRTDRDGDGYTELEEFLNGTNPQAAS